MLVLEQITELYLVPLWEDVIEIFKIELNYIMKTTNLIHLGSRKNIPSSNILMLKSDSNYTLIYLKDGSKILSSTSLGKIEKRLKDFQFFRPNRSTIFNLDFMADYEDKTQSGSYGKILLKNNEKISLSRRKSEIFIKMIQ